MKIILISNYFNHHQRFLCDELYRQTGKDFFFIETACMSEERKQMGWGVDVLPPYVISANDPAFTPEQKMGLIRDADVVIWGGGAPYCLIRQRLKDRRVVLWYSERIYKTGCSPFKMPLRILRMFRRYGRYKTLYALSASAFLPCDLKRTGTLSGKLYKFGYFTELRRYADIDSLLSQKEPASLLWVSRLIPLKHPEAPLFLAKHLKDEGYRFRLRMIGIGPLEERAKRFVVENGLTDCVEILGSMKPEEVRAHMERSEIFLFTSDKNEGWGAVLNEAMNSGCASVSSHAIGAAPFLIENGKNGFIYESGAAKELYARVKYLIDHPTERKEIGKAAYETMADQWNAENAAERLLNLCDAILANGKAPTLYPNGVCSKASVLKDNWYRKS